jgi:hypothetical protein
MPIVRVQGVGATETVQSTTLTATITASGAGNLLAVGIGIRAASPTITSVADSASQTYLAGISLVVGSAVIGAIYYFPNTASGVTTVTVTGGVSGTMEMFVWEFSGVLTASPLDGAGSSRTWPSTTTLATTGPAAIGSGLFTYAGVLSAGQQGVGVLLAFEAADLLTDVLLAGMVFSGSGTTVGSQTGGFTAETLQSSAVAGLVSNIQPAYQIASNLPPGFFASVGKPGPRVSNREFGRQGGY